MYSYPQEHSEHEVLVEVARQVLVSWSFESLFDNASVQISPEEVYFISPKVNAIRRDLNPDVESRQVGNAP